MTAEISMPRLSDTMEEGTVLRWLRQHGERVEDGEPVVEIETDKATTELPSLAAGMLHIVIDEGATVPVGGVLAYVGEPAALAQLANGSTNDRAASAANTSASEPAAPLPARGSSAPLAPAKAAAPSDDASVRARVRATPIARRVAAGAGVDVARIAPGSGPRGRVHKVDVERFLASTPAVSPVERLPNITNGVDAGGELVSISKMQGVIARRMSQSKREVPHFYLSTEVDCRRAMKLRTKLADRSGSAKVSLTDLIVQACGRALRSVPQVNASWSEEGIRRHHDIHIGLAVALDGDGLVVPVIRDVDRLTLADLAQIRSELVARARRRAIGPDELQGATFTVSNLGMLGVTEFHAIINPPESAILAVGALKDRFVPVDGQPRVRPMTTISLSADHRVYSGATAAAFLSAVRVGIEQPLRTIAGMTVRPS